MIRVARFLPSSQSRSVLSLHAPNGFLMTAWRHHTPSHLYPSRQKDWVCAECLEDEGTLKSRCTSSAAHTCCQALACLNTSPRQLYMNLEVGFSILPGVILSTCAKTTISKTILLWIPAGYSPWNPASLSVLSDISHRGANKPTTLHQTVGFSRNLLLK